MQRKKKQAIFIIAGLSVSVFSLMTTIFLMDTLSVSFTDYLGTKNGNIDYIVEKDTDNPNFFVDPFFSYSETARNLDGSFPNRFISTPRISFQSKFSPSLGSNGANLTVILVGINNTHEYNIQWGRFYDTDWNYSSTEIPINKCVISPFIAENLNLKEGDECSAFFENYSISLTVFAIAKSNGKFIYDEQSVVVNSVTLQQVIGLDIDQFNNFYIKIKDPSSVYDIRDDEATKKNTISLGESIKSSLGDTYTVETPKLDEILDAPIAWMQKIIFFLVFFLSILITIVLLYGILSTSVEQKIRDFGILKTLGAKNRTIFSFVLMEGVLFWLISSAIGFFTSYFLTRYILIPQFSNLLGGDWMDVTFSFMLDPGTVIFYLLLLLGATILVSTFPAIKGMRISIVESINPYHRNENRYRVIRSGRVNYILLISGVFFVFNSVFVYFFIPSLTVSFNPDDFTSLFTLFLCFFLLGMTLVGYSVIPLFQRLFIRILRPVMKKTGTYVELSLKAHQNRSKSMVILFSLSFVFLFVLSGSVVNMGIIDLNDQKYRSGSDIVVYATEDQDAPLTSEAEDIFLDIEGIESYSTVLASPRTLSNQNQNPNAFYVEISDLLDSKSTEISLYAPDEKYLRTIFREMVEFSSGNTETAFDELSTENDTCIVSSAIALALNLQLNDSVRLVFHQGKGIKIAEFRIVGLADYLPGFWEFGAMKISSKYGGVLISQTDYKKYMNLMDPCPLEKVFVKLAEVNHSNLEGAKFQIQSNLASEFNVFVENIAERTIVNDQIYRTVSLILNAILGISIGIVLIGEVSSIYSIALERKREFGTIKTLGLKDNQIYRAFIAEFLIILVSSILTGVLIGTLSSYLFIKIITLFFEQPMVFIFPSEILIISILLSAAIVLIGVYFVLRDVFRTNIIDLYRQTM